MTALLSGVRVLDMSRVFAGPWAGQMLADLGADVVKLEHPDGDDVRRMGVSSPEVANGQTSSFLAMNRGKRSIAIDFATESGRSVAQALASKADVLIENFRTGGLARFGLDYASVSAGNPGIVYCSITGFGQTGPYASLPGYDPVFQAMSGLMSITGAAEGAPGAGPAIVGYSVADINAGFYAVAGILAALRHRDLLSAQGRHIDVSLLDSQVAAQSHIALNWLVSGQMPARNGTASQINTPWQAFETADRPLMLAVGNDAQFRALCRAIGRPELAEDQRYSRNAGRMEHAATLLPEIAAALRQRPAAEWMAALETAGVSAGPLNDFGAMAEDPQVRHRGLLRAIPAGEGVVVPTVANPLRFDGAALDPARPPPAVGEHTGEVLRDWLGMGEVG